MLLWKSDLEHKNNYHGNVNLYIVFIVQLYKLTQFYTFVHGNYL